MGAPREPTADPIAALLALGDALARGQAPGPVVAAWVIGAIKVYLNGGGPLDRALGLAGQGWKGSTVHRYRERNGRLRAAATLLNDDVHALALALRRFESAPWPRWRSMATPPESATPVQHQLFNVFAAGAPVPSSARQLRRICIG
jgi:hypothetical protein